MLDKVQQYLQTKLSLDKTYLLGLSGGPDSTLLFHILLKSGFSFSVVYVDHGMRKESALEAKELAKLAKVYKIPFYIDQLSPIDWSGGNIEGILREQRYLSFQKIYKKIGASGLLLGHQKDDQIETVLKRVLEGGSVSALGGIFHESIRYGMDIYRPLLCFRKKEILEELKKREISYFFDQTNEDQRYLRARFRKKIIPQLEEDFGKEIGSNLYRLGENMQKIWSYVAKNVSSVMDQVIDGEMGLYLESLHLSDPIEWEYVLREMAKKAQITFSHSELERMIEIILERRYGKGLNRSGWTISLEKKGLFFFSPKIKDLESKGEIKIDLQQQNWREFLQNQKSIYIPDDQCSIGKPVLNATLPNGVTLAKWYSQHQVPIFFRAWFPVVYRKGVIVRECLTGKVVESKNHLLTFNGKKNTIISL